MCKNYFNEDEIGRYVARIKETNIAYRILVGNPEGKIKL
jgi:hypothetical protein